MHGQGWGSLPRLWEFTRGLGPPVVPHKEGALVVFWEEEGLGSDANQSREPRGQGPTVWAHALQDFRS